MSCHSFRQKIPTARDFAKQFLCGAMALILFLQNSLLCFATPGGSQHPLWPQALARNQSLQMDATFQSQIAQIPLSEWGDPELHLYLRNFLLSITTRMVGSPIRLLGERLRWAFEQNPALAEIWLPVDDLRTAGFVYDVFPESPFSGATRAHAEIISTMLMPDEALIAKFYKLLSSGKTNFANAFPSPIEWMRLNDLYRQNENLRERAVELVSRANSEFLNSSFTYLPDFARDVLSRSREPGLHFGNHEIPNMRAQLSRDPQLVARAYAATLINSHFLNDIWMNYPAVFPQLREEVQRMGLVRWVGILNAQITAHPQFDDFIREFPEGWFRAELQKIASTQIFGLNSGMFRNIFSRYVRYHPNVTHPTISPEPLHLVSTVSGRQMTTESDESLRGPLSSWVSSFFELPPPERNPLPRDESDALYKDNNPKAPKLETLAGPARSADLEDARRLGLGGEAAQTFRGINDRDFATINRGGGLFSSDRHDPEFAAGVTRGTEVRREFLKQGLLSLRRAQADLNPFHFLHDELQDFLRTQERALPMAPLPELEVQRRTNEELSSWLVNESDPVDLFMREQAEAQSRKRFRFVEEPRPNGRGDPLAGNGVTERRKNLEAERAFRKWRADMRKRIEERLRNILVTAHNELQPQGFTILNGPEGLPVNLTQISRFRFTADGLFVDAEGAPVSLRLSSPLRDESEQDLLLNLDPTPADSLSRQAVLLHQFDRALAHHSLAFQSLNRNAAQGFPLLHYYHWARDRYEPRFQDPGNATKLLTRFLWSKITREDVNYWRNVQSQAVAQNQPLHPINGSRQTRRLGNTILGMALLGLGVVGALDEISPSGRSSGSGCSGSSCQSSASVGNNSRQGDGGVTSDAGRGDRSRQQAPSPASDDSTFRRTRSRGDQASNSGSDITHGGGVMHPTMQNPGPPQSGHNGRGDSLYNLEVVGDLHARLPRFFNLGYNDEFQNHPIRLISSEIQDETRLHENDFEVSPKERRFIFSDENGPFHEDSVDYYRILRNQKWDPPHRSIKVSTTTFVQPDNNGIIPLVRPEGTILARIQLSALDIGARPVRLGENFEIVRDETTHEVALRLRNEGVTRWHERFQYDAYYVNAPPDSPESQEIALRTRGHHEDPTLEGRRFSDRVSLLDGAGFHVLAEGLQNDFTANRDTLRLSQLADGFAHENRYSYRQVAMLPRATPSEWAANPFLPYANGLNENHRFVAVCGAQNLVLTEFVNSYYGPTGQYRAEVRPTFSNQDGDTALTSDEAHARTYVYVFDERPFSGAQARRLALILDSTPALGDGYKGQFRRDELPSRAPTDHQRRKDLLHLLEYAFVARDGDRENQNDFFNELERRTRLRRNEPESPAEYLLRTWRARVNHSVAAEEIEAHTVIEPGEALSRSRPLYDNLTLVRTQRRRLTEAMGVYIQNGSRRSQDPAAPVNRVLSLGGQMENMLNDPLPAADWHREQIRMREAVAELRQRAEDLQTSKQMRKRLMGAARAAQNSTLPVEARPIRQPLSQRVLNHQASRELEDRAIALQFSKQLDALTSFIDSMEDARREAFVQVRAYQPEEHARRLAATANLAPENQGTNGAGTPVRQDDECILRSLSQTVTIPYRSPRRTN